MQIIGKYIDTFIEDRSSEIFKHFENLVNINSFSQNLEGIKEVYDYIEEIANAYSIEMKTVYSSSKNRPHLMYQQELKRDYYALIGHVDTVHPPESDFNRIVEKDGIYYGPGTNDMKSGIIVVLYSLFILRNIHKDKNIPIKLLFNSDEEIGTYDSKEIILNEFKNALAGFVFEPGRSSGNKIVTGRKGVFNLSIYIKGKPSHAGIEPEKGINAILAASILIQKLHELNDYDKGVTIGCNMIEGGIAINVVAPYCKIEVDGRFITEEQGAEVINKIGKIVNTFNSDGAKANYNIGHIRQPLVKNSKSDELFKQYKNIYRKIGLECSEVSTGGGSDANILSSMGIPTLDGLGAIGNFSHTKKEFTIKRTILERIKVFTLFMNGLIAKQLAS